MHHTSLSRTILLQGRILTRKELVCFSRSLPVNANDSFGKQKWRPYGTTSLARASWLPSRFCRPCHVKTRLFSNENNSEIVTLEELKDMIKRNDIQLFDVRQPGELRTTGAIPKSTNIPLSEVPKAFAHDKEDFEAIYGVQKPNEEDKNIVFHCLAGIRSDHALRAVQQLGYKNARHYAGGWEEWEMQHVKMEH